MKLVTFDVDGTLIRSTGVDDDCFLHALESAWGVTDVCTDWNTYQHITESGIAEELFRSRFGRFPRPQELSQLQSEFEHQLRLALTGMTIDQVPGAHNLLTSLQNSDQWRVAIATGSWSSALGIKTSAAGLTLSQFAVATADDALDRADVIQTATRRAEKDYGIPRFESVIYVGDGLWDARAAASIQIPFIGIASGDRAARLAAAGAKDVMPDFTDPHRFLKAIESSTPGRSSKSQLL